MPSPKIFISHSIDKTKECEQKFLWDLHDLLQEHGLEVLLDVSRLHEDPGGPWRPTLNTWLEICDAAIIVFNDRARDESSWVVYESAILVGKKRSEKDFLLVPLLMPSVETGDLSKGRFAPHQLGELQAFRTDDTAWFEKLAPALDDLKARLETLTRRLSPAGEMEQTLTSYLTEFVRDDQAIIRAAADLGVDLTRWQPKLDKRRALARLLLQADLPNACQAVRKHLISFTTAQLIAIREYLAPGWINCQAVRMISQIASAAPPRERSLAVNTANVETLKMYLRRASGLLPERSWKDVVVNPPMAVDDPMRETIYEIIDAYRRRLNMNEDDVRKTLNHVAMDDVTEAEPMFVLLNCADELPTARDLDQLHEEFQAVTIFIPTGSKIPIEGCSPIPGACFLEPALDTQDEKTFYEGYRIAKLKTE